MSIHLTDDGEDYTDEQTFSVGDRVELSPACDLWMRGAKYGQIAAVAPLRVRMDYTAVKRLIVVNKTLIRHTR